MQVEEGVLRMVVHSCPKCGKETTYDAEKDKERMLKDYGDACFWCAGTGKRKKDE